MQAIPEGLLHVQVCFSEVCISLLALLPPLEAAACIGAHLLHAQMFCRRVASWPNCPARLRHLGHECCCKAKALLAAEEILLKRIATYDVSACVQPAGGGDQPAGAAG